MADHCAHCIDMMPGLFPRACTLHAPLPLCFVRQPCSQELSGGVPNGMFSIVFGPYVCVWVTAYICMNEK